MLKLSHKDFKAATLKVLQQILLEKWKIEKLVENIKCKLYRTEKYNNQKKKKTYWMCSTIVWRDRICELRTNQ